MTGWITRRTTEEYLKLAGLLGGSSQTGGRGEIPAILKSATSLSAAVRAVDQDGTLVLEFDSSGKDGDFIEKVPLKLSADGENWQEESVNGWKRVRPRYALPIPIPMQEPYT